MFGGITKCGVCFGLVSGVITTLGLMIGLNAGTHSTIVVIGGIITIAVADALSDALGMHISKEAERLHTANEVWTCTFMTFISKLIVAMTFVIPIMFLPLQTAVIVCVAWGLSLIAALSFIIARSEDKSVLKTIGEHVLIAIIVVLAANFIGRWVSLNFN